MYLDVYIGWLDDPSFSWDGGDWDGNVPVRRSPFPLRLMVQTAVISTS